MSGMLGGFTLAFGPATFVLLALVCILAATVGGISGFGVGLIITLFVTPLIGAKAVVPAMAVVMVINNSSRVWFFRSALDWRVIRLVAGPGIVTAALGSLVYVRLDAATVQTILGAILIVSVIARHAAARTNWRATVPVLCGVGGIFGFLSSITVGTGILLIPLLFSAGLVGPALLATDATISLTISFIKILMFGKLNALTPELFVIALLMGLCTIPGTWLAAQIVRRTSMRIQAVLVEALVLCGGAYMIVTALFR